MVQGVLVCGTFITKRALMVTASLLVLVLILGCIFLGIGLAMCCGYSNSVSLVINGGVLMGFTIIGLIVIVALSYRVRETPVPAQPPVVTQPYTVMPVYGQAATGYPAAVPGQPQQFQPQVTASTSAGDNQSQPQY